MSRHHEEQEGPPTGRAARLQQLNAALRTMYDGLLGLAKRMAQSPGVRYGSAITHKNLRVGVHQQSFLVDPIRREIPRLLREAGIESGRAVLVDFSAVRTMTVFLEGHEECLRGIAVRQLAQTIRTLCNEGITGLFLCAASLLLFKDTDLIGRLRSELPQPLADSLWVNMPVVTWESTVPRAQYHGELPFRTAGFTMNGLPIVPFQMSWEVLGETKERNRGPMRYARIRNLRPVENRGPMLVHCADEDDIKRIIDVMGGPQRCRGFVTESAERFVVAEDAAWVFDYDDGLLAREVTGLIKRVLCVGTSYSGNLVELDFAVDPDRLGLLIQQRISYLRHTQKDDDATRAELRLLPLVRYFHKRGQFYLTIPRIEYDAEIYEKLDRVIGDPDVARIALQYWRTDDGLWLTDPPEWE